MSKWCVYCAAAAAMAALAGPVWAADTTVVTLTVEEEAGVNRVNEPVTAGVPLPEGLVDDAARV